MIKIIATEDIKHNEEYLLEMYSARAKIFKERLGWGVDVVDGLEMDLYDRVHNPVYIISGGAEGDLTGSLRILPTTGPNMLQEDFKAFFSPELKVKSPTIWECTRFCVHPNVRPTESRHVATELLHALCKLARCSGIEHIVGVYDASMLGVYRQIGWFPETKAKSNPVFGNIMVGLWHVSEEIETELARRLSVLKKGSVGFAPFARPPVPAPNTRPSF